MSTPGRPGREELEVIGSTSPVGLLSWKAAARYLSLSESSLRRLVRAGEIPPPIVITAGRKGFPFENIEGFRQRVISRSRRA